MIKSSKNIALVILISRNTKINIPFIFLNKRIILCNNQKTSQYVLIYQLCKILFF